MRALAAATLLLLALPPTLAGYGTYGEDGWPVSVDGHSTAPDPLNRLAGATMYPYWPILTAEVQRLADTYPEVVRLHSAGTSTLGLELWVLEIADFARLEAGEGTPLEARETVWVDGGTHSNEYSGVYFTLAVAQWLASGYGTDENATWVVESRHTWLLPMVNPDGSNAFGRLNANGVNINRNYPVVWDGEGNDLLMNNRGPEPASEVETRITIDWYNQTRPDYMASIHCCGNLWLYPYGEEGVDPPDQEMLQRVCDDAFPGVRDACGPIWSTIYPASGSSVDTAYEYTGAVAFGYEMSGRGALALWGQPVTFEDVFAQEHESWQGLRHAFLNVHRYGAHLEIEDAAPTADGLRLVIRNTGYGPLAGGSAVLDDRAVAIPDLAAGEAAEVALPGRINETPSSLRLEYPKRIMAAPLANVSFQASLDGAGALLLSGPGDAAAKPSGRPDAASEAAPGAPSALVAAGLLVVLARRRR